MSPWALIGYRVRAAQHIQQSPLSDDPAVPINTVGVVEDWNSLDQVYAVDFGDPYGVVLCLAEEIKS